MKLRYLKKLVIFVFLLNYFLFGQDTTKNQSDVTQYQNSFELYEKSAQKQIKEDVEYKIKKALELKNININITRQRLQEIIFLYPEFLKNEQKILDFILKEILSIYIKVKTINDFQIFLNSLKELGVIDQNIENTYIEKYKQTTVD